MTYTTITAEEWVARGKREYLKRELDKLNERMVRIADAWLTPLWPTKKK